MPHPGAYERALRPLLPAAAGYARSIVRSRHDVEDAVQQAALRGWERIDQYDRSRPFKGWWFAILRNCCFDMLRRSAAARTGPLGGLDPPAPDEPDPVDWEGLDDALRGLSQDHHDILRLRYFGGLKYDEIAAALAIPRGTVMSRLHLARKALAAQMRKEEEA
ncbi:MAG: RNA polymerase sigma factor [Sphingomonadales bacterium]